MDVTFFENQPFYAKANIQGESEREFQLWETGHETEKITTSYAALAQISIPLISPISEPESNTQTQPSSEVPEPVPESKDLIGYSRRPKSKKEVECCTSPKQNHTSEPDAALEKRTGNTLSDQISIDSTNDLNQPIAVRKGIRKCTLYPIGNYVSYGNLLPAYKAFTSIITEVKILGTIQ